MLKVNRLFNNEIVKSIGSVDKTVVKSLILKKIIFVQKIGTIEKHNFLIFNAKKAFNYLKQVFINALIL